MKATRDQILRGRSQREVLHDSAFARLAAKHQTMPVIEQAKGVIMAQQGCTPEEAFDLLRRHPSGPTSRCTCWRHRSSSTPGGEGE